MKKISVALLLVCFLTGIAEAGTRFRWSLRLPDYGFEMTTAIGAIDPQNTGPVTDEEMAAGEMVPEHRYARWASGGGEVYKHLIATQHQYVWFLGSIQPDRPDGRYDGGLDSLTLVLKDGTKRGVSQIVAGYMKVGWLNKSIAHGPMNYLFPTYGSRPLYQEFESDGESGKVWYVFLGFDRSNLDLYQVEGIKVPAAQFGQVGR